MARGIKEDVIGKKFGLLEVTNTFWDGKRTICICKCDCGGEYKGRLDSLKAGLTTSCGCVNKKNLFKQKDISNQRFSRLVAIKSTNRKTKDGGYLWECICDCGNICEVPIDNLTSGKTRSCGCLAEEVQRNNQDAFKIFNEVNLKEGTNLALISRTTPPSNNTSGHKGVVWDKSRQKWRVYIEFQGKRRYLGQFDDKDKEYAIRTRKEAEEKYFKPLIEKYKSGK